MTIYYPTGDWEYYNSFQKDWMLVNGIPRKETYKFWYDYIAGILKKEFVGAKILDAGCGEGLVINNLNNPTIAGFDIHQNRINIAKEINPNNYFFQSSINNIDSLNNTFDCTYTVHALEQCNLIKEQALKELIRITTKRLIFIEPIYEYAGVIQRFRMKKKKYLQGFISLLEKYERDGKLNIIKNKPLNISSTPFNRSWLIVVEIIK